MDTAALIATLGATLTILERSGDELRDLDAALGDGDLGITVTAGCRAARTALAELPDDTALPQVLRVVGRAFAKANPSTMAALVGGALLNAARALGEAPDLGPAEALTVGRAAAESISSRGRSAVGDKTILDALVPSLDAFASASGDPLSAAIRGARAGVEHTQELQSMRGRASWLGERSMGHPDPGATAYVRLLEALDEAFAQRADRDRTQP